MPDTLTRSSPSRPRLCGSVGINTSGVQASELLDPRATLPAASGKCSRRTECELGTESRDRDWTESVFNVVIEAACGLGVASAESVSVEVVRVIEQAACGLGVVRAESVSVEVVRGIEAACGLGVVRDWAESVFKLVIEAACGLGVRAACGLGVA